MSLEDRADHEWSRGNVVKVVLKKELVHLMPILASLLFGLLCAYVIIPPEVEITPFSEGVGSIGNAVYFVVLVGVGATMLYLLLKRKSLRLISIMTGFALTTAVFMLSFIYLYSVLSIFTVAFSEIWVLAAAMVMTILADWAIFRTRRVANVIILGLGGALGTFLGVLIPTQSTVLILGFLAVYDVFAVYRGPVGKIAQSGLDQFRGLSFSFRDIQMGLGDLTFYSMLVGHMWIFFGPAACLAGVIGVLGGCLVSFRMLEKKGMFPGLPLPIFLGLTASFLATMFS
jgi:presenilin-like A22 family membrane protease